MRDEQTGISLRFIRQFDAEMGRRMKTELDIAAQIMMLMMADDREVPVAQKRADAIAFLKSRTH